MVENMTRLYRKNMLLQDIRDIYIDLVKEFGEDAFSTIWLERNGRGWIYDRIRKKYKIKWSDFRQQCGFNGILRRDALSLEDLKKEYKKIVEEYGEDSYSSNWINNNGYSWLYAQVTKKYKMKWNDFKNKCGGKILTNQNLSLNDLVYQYKVIVREHGQDSYSSSWLSENGYLWLYQQIAKKHKIKWSDFRRQCGFDIKLNFTERSETLEDLKEIYKGIVEEHGEIAYSSSWLIKNNYCWLYESLSKKHKIKWSDFRGQCGFDNVLVREVLSLEDLKNKYKNIVSEYGKDSYSSNWLRDNNFGWLYSQVSDHYKIRWNNFKKQCGFNKMLKRPFLSLGDLKKEYENIVKKNGTRAYSCSWLEKNGDGWLHQQVLFKHKVPWRQFVQMCKEEIEIEFEW